MIDRCQNCGCAIDDDINAAVEIANEDLQDEIVSQRKQIEALTAQVGVLRKAVEMNKMLLRDMPNTIHVAVVQVANEKALATTPESVLSEVRKTERGRCAKVCEELRHPDGYSGENVDWCAGTDHCAAAIRAMGDE